MIILGIDPGLATIGWGVIETNGFKHNSVAFGHIQTPTKLSVEKRLAMIFDDLDTILLMIPLLIMMIGFTVSLIHHVHTQNLVMMMRM